MELLVKKPGSYRGLIERAAPGVHQACADLLLNRFGMENLKSVRHLDVAAGNGAFIRRLEDLGVTASDAIEIDLEHFTVPHIKPRVIDLNSDFASAYNCIYSMISAIEIIEHLDCPRDFLRNVRRLLDKDGYLLLTTPNIEQWLARVKFLLRGELQYFTPADYHEQRHISPITDYHMKLMFREIGLKLVAQSAGGSFRGPVKQVLYWPFGVLSRFLKGHIAAGDANIYLVQKAEPEKFPGCDSFYF